MSKALSPPKASGQTLTLLQTPVISAMCLACVFVYTQTQCVVGYGWIEFPAYQAYGRGEGMNRLMV